MKRAQIEMMGLVVIVILITIGLFFSMAFKQTEPVKTPLSVYSDEELAMNFLITFLETNIPESSANMHDLAIDCARVQGEATPHYNFGTGNSCEILESILDNVLSDTLDEWNYAYELTLTYDPGEDPKTVFTLKSDEFGCTGERSAPGWLPISLFRVVPGKLIFQLDICS